MTEFDVEGVNFKSAVVKWWLLACLDFLQEIQFAFSSINAFFLSLCGEKGAFTYYVWISIIFSS